jgi:hypothetical protein
MASSIPMLRALIQLEPRSRPPRLIELSDNSGALAVRDKNAFLSREVSHSAEV